MKKLFLSLVLVVFMVVPVFAQVDITGPETHGALSPVTGSNAQAGAYSSSSANALGIGIANVDNNIRNTNVLSNINVNDPDFYNQNLNFGVNAQNNDQVIAPSQDVSVVFNSPVQLPSVNTAGLSELNFGSGRTKIVTNSFPLFDSKIKRFDPTKERLAGQVDEVANEPLKRFIGKASGLLAKHNKQAGNYRYIIVMSEANKTLQGGVNLNGLGTGVSSTSASGGGGGGLLGFQGGITKGWDLYTMIVVKVVPI